MSMSLGKAKRAAAYTMKGKNSNGVTVEQTLKSIIAEKRSWCDHRQQLVFEEPYCWNYNQTES